MEKTKKHAYGLKKAKNHYFISGFLPYFILPQQERGTIDHDFLMVYKGNRVWLWESITSFPRFLCSSLNLNDWKK